MAPLLILFTERKFILTHYYDSNKVDILVSITFDDRQNITLGVNLRYSLSIPFINRMEGITVTVILMNPSELIQILQIEL